MRKKVIDTSCGPIRFDEDLYRDNANTIFLADADLQAVEYVTMDEHKRVCAERDELRKALKRVASHHAGGCNGAMLAVAEARAVLQEVME